MHVTKTRKPSRKAGFFRPQLRIFTLVAGAISSEFYVRLVFVFSPYFSPPILMAAKNGKDAVSLSPVLTLGKPILFP
jgi:hypothetical protein